MKISFDAEADALYVQIVKGKFHSNKKVDENTVLDLDEKGRVLGLEIIGVKERVGEKGVLELMVKVQQKKSARPLVESLNIPLTT
ncbi:MAG: DUF2283 domain-containing protein [Candidatus Altiarchaeales archaeon]|nr:DUF2283 domain-containing protein [Candidatus Altiarchaeales archaeon]